MSSIYVHHRLNCEPRRWLDVANQVINLNYFALADNETALYGIWRSQIGLPRDTLTIISVWPDAEIAKKMSAQIGFEMKMVKTVESHIMAPTVRPKVIHRPEKQGNYAFRWFQTPVESFDEFLNCCFCQLFFSLFYLCSY